MKTSTEIVAAQAKTRSIVEDCEAVLNGRNRTARRQFTFSCEAMWFMA